MLPKCSRKEGRRDFSNRSSVEATMTGRSCVFLGESKSTLFGLPKVDAFRNHWLRFFLQHNSTTQMFCIFAMHFMDDHFVDLAVHEAGA